MDPITHGLIGAAAAQSVANREKLRMATLTSAAAAMLPDVDVFLGNSADPLLNLELHRQFTHSLIFIPVGALLATLLLWWLVKKKLTFKESYLFSLLGFASGGIADLFTSYGVQLLWPFTDERISWNLISVFDPFFSLGLIITVALAIYSSKKKFGRIALGWAGLYLLFGLVQQNRAEKAALPLADSRGHQIQQLITKPTIANELLWSIRYTSADSLHAYGIQLLPFAEPVLYEGKTVALLNWQQKYERYRGTTLFKDIQRFSTLSEGILIAHPDYKNVIGDGRYAMLPTSISPLWGIEADTAKPGKHITFKTYRDPSKEVRQRFKEMLLGH